MVRHTLKNRIEERRKILNDVWFFPETVTDALAEPTDSHWWEFWKVDINREQGIEAVVRYLINSADDFLKIVKQYIKETSVKNMETIESMYTEGKQYIIDSIEELYSAIVSLPWWLKPLTGAVKRIVVSIVVPALLDYVWKNYLLITVSTEE